MKIDLKSEIGIPETMVSKSNKLIEHLVDLNKNRRYRMSYLIIPPSILNIIELSQYFYTYSINNEIESPFLIGNVVGYDCYVDLYLPPDTIIVQCDKQSMRELKIESLLQKDIEDSEIEIEVII